MVPAVLIPIALKIAETVGAKLLSKVLKIGGPKAESVAGTVIDLVKETTGLGYEELSSTLDSEVVLNDAVRDTHVANDIRTYEKENESTLLDTLVEMSSEVNVSLREESKSGDPWTRRWRPFIGYSFGAQCTAIVGTVCYVLWTGTEIDTGMYAPLLSLVVPVITTEAAVVGAYVINRTKERLGGVS